MNAKQIECKFAVMGARFKVNVTPAQRQSRDWGRDAINEKLALRNEALRRGAGKAHIVEDLFRVAGQLVYVCPKYPTGVTEARYRQLLQNRPGAAQWGWRTMRRNPRVYAKGRIRHPDHATITLPDWHRVVLNTETETETMRNVVFLD